MKPLHNKRILITRARKQATEFASRLQEQGALPVFLPTIEIAPVKDPYELDHALRNIEAYDWLLLTSANAVFTVWHRLEALGIPKLPDRLRVAAIGQKTAGLLQKRGVRVDFVPEEYIGESLATGLGDLQDLKVLLPVADLAQRTLPDAIRTSGGNPHVITAYHTIPAETNMTGIQAVLQGLDAITFTSGSTVRNFITLLEEYHIDPLNMSGSPAIACIGPKTAKAASEAGMYVHITAAEYTIDGLLQALQEYFTTKDTHKQIS